MNIGQKIKKMRTAKLMTQAELAGSEITRNMLSQIENGVAQPSLDTVRYLASRLNVSPSFLLAEGAEEQVYLKYVDIVNIKKAYMNEDFRICRDLCLKADSQGDDEIGMILSECNLEIAVEEFNTGNLRMACACFDECIESCTATIYRTETVLAKIALYFRYMRLISATLGSNVIDEEEINLYPALTDDVSRYMWLMDQTESALQRELPLPDIDAMGMDQTKAYYLHLEARSWIRQRNYAAAFQNLHGILVDQQFIPEPMLYFVFCDLELCCRELDDYKRAYEYNNDKLALLQKMLT